jgi:hypothetical protein
MRTKIAERNGAKPRTKGVEDIGFLHVGGLPTGNGREGTSKSKLMCP